MERWPIAITAKRHAWCSWPGFALAALAQSSRCWRKLQRPERFFATNRFGGRAQSKSLCAMHSPLNKMTSMHTGRIALFYGVHLRLSNIPCGREKYREFAEVAAPTLHCLDT
jgi:hypothetical protein